MGLEMTYLTLILLIAMGVGGYILGVTTGYDLANQDYDYFLDELERDDEN